jgi:cardiolipin synthase
LLAIKYASIILIGSGMTFPSGCTVKMADRQQEAVALVGDVGEVSSRGTEKVAKKLAAQSGQATESIERNLSVIASLSDVPIYKDNRVELLIDGPATYASMLDAIQRAENYILLETYIFADDDAGNEFANLLSKKCREGVDVKIIYDSIGSMDSDEEMFSSMESSGISIIEYNSINPVEGGNPAVLNNRDHRKILVVDGEIAYTGGINLADAYSSGSGSVKRKRDVVKEGWRDTHIAVRGPAVQGFEAIFLDNWRQQGETVALPVPRAGNRQAGQEVVAILTATGGNSDGSEIFAAYLDAIENATQRIWITQAYFAPGEEFLELLENAARRNVDVRLVVPGVSDSKLVLNASRSRYGRLLKSGVRIYENQQAVLHAKTAVIDEYWSTVGSSNLDSRSFLHNDEINAIILGTQFAEIMQAQFRRDLEQAQEISLRDWQDRSMLARLGEGFSWFIEYWL